ncbi:MAG: four helix bundle protein [Planctomycetaceae bacterium]|nr:four helix bundle protein [Planctomycetaceae bacterium]
MDKKQLQSRTRQFALRIIRLAAALPKSRLGDVLGRRVLRSGTSIGANYREALRASSRKHFITTLEIVVREADETLYWLELIQDSETIKATRLESLIKECGELIAIFVATIRSTKDR